VEDKRRRSRLSVRVRADDPSPPFLYSGRRIGRRRAQGPPPSTLLADGAVYLCDMDDTAFTRLAEAYAARLYAVAFRLLGNRADAQDAVQRALLKSYAARESYSPRWAVSTWLYRILTNVCVDELRRRRPTTDIADVRVSTPSSAGAIGDRVDVSRALETVPREARVLLALHYVDGLSHHELAAIRGISVNTVKSQLARGKTIMRAALQRGRHGSVRRPAR